jgi:hypothetical protein
LRSRRGRRERSAEGTENGGDGGKGGNRRGTEKQRRAEFCFTRHISAVIAIRATSAHRRCDLIRAILRVGVRRAKVAPRSSRLTFHPPVEKMPSSLTFSRTKDWPSTCSPCHALRGRRWPSATGPLPKATASRDRVSRTTNDRIGSEVVRILCSSLLLRSSAVSSLPSAPPFSVPSVLRSPCPLCACGSRPVPWHSP